MSGSSGRRGGAAAAAAALVARSSLEWKLYNDIKHLSEGQISTIISKNPIFCGGYRDLSCYRDSIEDPTGVTCQFNPSGDRHFTRNVIVKENVHDPRRFLCDKLGKGKIGVLVYSKTHSHVMLVRSYNGPWGIPKGTFDMDDSDPYVGSRRELIEETGSWAKEIALYRMVPAGIRVTKGEFHPFNIKSRGKEPIFLFYCTTDMKTIPNLEDLLDVDYEITEIAWFELGNLPKKLNMFTREIRDKVNRKELLTDAGIAVNL